MKKLFALLVLVVAATACQHQPPPVQAVAATPIKAQAAASTTVLVADSLTPAMRATLRRVDLSDLFLAPAARQNGGEQSALDGFFGSNPQRLSLAMLQITRDSLHPEFFRVAGKTRYKKEVTSFAGSMQITSLPDYYDPAMLTTQGEDSFIQDTTTGGTGLITNAKAYSASALFRFDGQDAAYTLSGRVLLDFWLTTNGRIGMMYAPGEGAILEDAPTKGSGLLLRGNWLDATAKTPKKFVVSRDVFFVSNALVDNFGIGDRGSQVNPKYAKMGWNTYWGNDEWWADTPKPSLNL